jgi:hypothetical protein
MAVARKAEMEPSHSPLGQGAEPARAEASSDSPESDEFPATAQSAHLTGEPASLDEESSGRTGKQPEEVLEPGTVLVARSPFKLGLGVFLGFIAAMVAAAAFVFIWFGVFPSVIALLLCLPIALLSARLIRKSRPVRTM